MTQISAALAGQPLLIVLALLLTALLIVAMGAVTWSFDLRRSRLPQATAWEDLSQRLTGLVGQVTEKQAELQEIKRQLQERDQIAAEVTVLRKMLDDLNLEWSSKEESRRQIEEIKHKAAEAATEYAEISGKLEDTRRELSEAEDQLTRLTAMRDEVPRLQIEIEAQRAERATLQGEINTLREELTRVQADAREARDLVGNIDTLRRHVENLQRQKEQTDTEVAEAERRRIEMQRILDTLQPDLVEARRLSASLPELEARRAALEQKIKELEQANEPKSGPAAAERNPLADLRRLPACLSDLSGPDREPERESAAVAAVCNRLKDLGLRYSPRVVRAFHTALKINETAQITVLAGVSGTGKSLLPRRYAEAMGIGFLQIAVEPRWDSPQDLLGFYNYVEQRYRATDLARALVHMDPFNMSELAEAPLGDRMLLVLMDEMNLARIEYYFSEFLSRLEVRPPYAEAGDAAKRRDASMPIDIRGRKEGPVYLFPSYNVLFAGTMNDDESTQALSDKVLDRSNVMQFPAPQEFAPNVFSAPPQLPSGSRRFSEWRSWIRPLGSLPDAERRQSEDIIIKLARIMEDFGRPFGHRLNEAILTYIANYPRQEPQLINEPMADQIEFRILPKLRGVPIEETRAEFDRLGKLIRDDLNDHRFADEVANLVERQGRGSGQFNWRGLDRG